MYYSFAPYEQDFRAWWESRAYPEVSPLTRDFLLHLARKDAPRKLWRHQAEAVLRVVYAYELLQWREILLNIVTGGGKTAVMGAVIAWLKTCHDLHKFVLLCPNTIVRDRLEDDFRDGKVFKDRDLLPEWGHVQPQDFILTTLGSGKDLDPNFSPSQLAELYGVSRQRVWALAKPYNVQLKGMNRSKHPRNRSE